MLHTRLPGEERIAGRGPQGSRFPPPWSIADIGAAFVVKDSAGQKLGLFITKKSRGGNS
jgi:hypothetical protein